MSNTILTRNVGDLWWNTLTAQHPRLKPEHWEHTIDLLERANHELHEDFLKADEFMLAEVEPADETKNLIVFYRVVSNETVMAELPISWRKPKGWIDSLHRDQLPARIKSRLLPT